MPEDPVKLVPVPNQSRKATWCLRLMVGSLVLFLCPCLLPGLRELVMNMSGVHVHPHSKLFEAMLVGCMVVGVLMNVAAAVLGVWALCEIRFAAGQLGGGGPARAGIGGGIGVLVLVALGTPAVMSAREAARRTQCRCYMKQLGLAFHNYHDTYGSFPPAAICDTDGKPLLSWRIAILPYLERAALYKQFHLDEPWDSPHNLPLAAEVPDVFQCLSDRASLPHASSYVIVAGAETFFPSDGTVGINNVSDGTAMTIMVGEVTGNTAPWTKPDNLVFDQRFDGQVEFSSGHPGGWTALMGDGTVRAISRSVPSQVIRALLTIAGGEPVKWNDF